MKVTAIDCSVRDPLQGELISYYSKDIFSPELIVLVLTYNGIQYSAGYVISRCCYLMVWGERGLVCLFRTTEHIGVEMK
jgi:hypothetical protein